MSVVDQAVDDPKIAVIAVSEHNTTVAFTRAQNQACDWCSTTNTRSFHYRYFRKNVMS